jgi:hypothetical protein
MMREVVLLADGPGSRSTMMFALTMGREVATITFEDGAICANAVERNKAAKFGVVHATHDLLPPDTPVEVRLPLFVSVALATFAAWSPDSIALGGNISPDLLETLRRIAAPVQVRAPLQGLEPHEVAHLGKILR